MIPINYHRLNIQNNRNASAFNASQLNVIISEKTTRFITELDIDSQLIVFFKTDVNYIEIFLNSGSKTLKRLTMKSLEKILNAHPNYVKIQRSYIVNINQIASVTANAQG